MQFSLRALLVLVFLAALLLGVFRAERERERRYEQAVEGLRQLRDLKVSVSSELRNRFDDRRTMPVFYVPSSFRDDPLARELSYLPIFRCDSLDSDKLTAALLLMPRYPHAVELEIRGETMPEHWRLMAEVPIERLVINRAPPRGAELSRLPRRSLTIHPEGSAREYARLLATTSIEALTIELDEDRQFDFALLRSHSQLRSLTVSGAGFELTSAAIREVAHLRQLRHLGLHRMSLEPGTITELSRLKGLQSLSVSQCILPNDALTCWDQFPNLKRLRVGLALIDRDAAISIARCKNLVELTLWNCWITDDALAALEPLKKLRRLDLSRAMMTIARHGFEDRPLALQRLPCLPNLVELRLDYANVAKGNWEALARHPRLRQLVVSSRHDKNDDTQMVDGLLRVLTLKSIVVESLYGNFLGLPPSFERLQNRGVRVYDSLWY